MLLNATGHIDPTYITALLENISKDFKPLSLPLCIDFDSIFHVEHPTRYRPRSNVDNPIENTYYVFSPTQALENQERLCHLPDTGYFYSILPCLDLAVENSTTYTTNILVEVMIVGENRFSELVTRIKGYYLDVGLDTNKVNFLPTPDTVSSLDIVVNYITIGTVSVIELSSGKTVTRATILKEPIFTAAINRIP